jgi:hypothetical protein
MVAPMTFDPAQLPDDVASLKAMLIANALEAEARAAPAVRPLVGARAAHRPA